MAETAREYFEDVAEAVRQHRQAELILAFGQPRAGDPGGSGCYAVDPVFSRLLSDDAARETMAATEEIIGDGLRVIEGLRRVYPGMAEVLELRYIDLLSWRETADAMHASVSSVRYYQDVIYRFVDTVGFARIRELA